MSTTRTFPALVQTCPDCGREFIGQHHRQEVTAADLVADALTNLRGGNDLLAQEQHIKCSTELLVEQMTLKSELHNLLLRVRQLEGETRYTPKERRK